MTITRNTLEQLFELAPKRMDTRTFKFPSAVEVKSDGQIEFKDLTGESKEGASFPLLVFPSYVSYIGNDTTTAVTTSGGTFCHKSDILGLVDEVKFDLPVYAKPDKAKDEITYVIDQNDLHKRLFLRTAYPKSLELPELKKYDIKDAYGCRPMFKMEFFRLPNIPHQDSFVSSENGLLNPLAKEFLEIKTQYKPYSLRLMECLTWHECIYLSQVNQDWYFTVNQNTHILTNQIKVLLNPLIHIPSPTNSILRWLKISRLHHTLTEHKKQLDKKIDNCRSSNTYSAFCAEREHISMFVRNTHACGSCGDSVSYGIHLENERHVNTVIAMSCENCYKRRFWNLVEVNELWDLSLEQLAKVPSWRFAVKDRDTSTIEDIYCTEDLYEAWIDAASNNELREPIYTEHTRTKDLPGLIKLKRALKADSDESKKYYTGLIIALIKEGRPFTLFKQRKLDILFQEILLKKPFLWEIFKCELITIFCEAYKSNVPAVLNRLITFCKSQQLEPDVHLIIERLLKDGFLSAAENARSVNEHKIDYQNNNFISALFSFKQLEKLQWQPLFNDFIKKGCVLNMDDEKNKSILLDNWGRDTNILRALIEAKADVNFQQKYSKIQQENKDTSQRLLEEKEKRGRTALMTTIDEWHFENAKVLLSHGALCNQIVYFTKVDCMVSDNPFSSNFKPDYHPVINFDELIKRVNDSPRSETAFTGLVKYFFCRAAQNAHFPNQLTTMHSGFLSEEAKICFNVMCEQEEKRLIEKQKPYTKLEKELLDALQTKDYFESFYPDYYEFSQKMYALLIKLQLYYQLSLYLDESLKEELIKAYELQFSKVVHPFLPSHWIASDYYFVDIQALATQRKLVFSRAASSAQKSLAFCTVFNDHNMINHIFDFLELRKEANHCFAKFAALNQLNRNQILCSYPEVFNSYIIPLAVEASLISFAVKKELFLAISLGPDAKEQSYQLSVELDKKLQTLSKNKRYILFALPVQGSEHAVTVVIDIQRKEIVVVDPKNLTSEEACTRINNLKSSSLNFKEYSVITANKDECKPQQLAQDNTNCGVLSAFEQVGIVLKRENIQRASFFYKDPTTGQGYSKGQNKFAISSMRGGLLWAFANYKALTGKEPEPAPAPDGRHPGI